MVEKVERNGTHAAGLTDEEAALYDRQIRLWGVEAQQRLRKARILLVGLAGLGNEICKNILLAGIQHLTMLDDATMTEDDTLMQFLSPQENVGKNKAESCYTRAKKLNPLVDIVVDTESIAQKSESFLGNFDVVCMTGYDLALQEKVNAICHKLDVKFLSGNTFGYYGYMFADLQEHKYMEEKVKVLKATDSSTNGQDGPSSAKKPKKDANEEVEYEEQETSFCSLADAMSVSLFEGMSLRQAKQVSKTYLVFCVLEEYYKRHKRYPDLIGSNQEVDDLLEVRNDVFEKLKIDNELLGDEFTSNCAGEFYPVNAIVGGVMAQEVIKAVSGKDTPHNNFFFYDGVATTGMVQNISKVQKEKKMKKEKTNQPFSEAVVL